MKLYYLLVIAVAFSCAPENKPADGESPESIRLKYNNPGLVVDLGVGLWANPVPVDWDGDGDTDLLASTTDKPSNGLYLFENNGNDIFSPGRRIAEGKRRMSVSWPGGIITVCTPGIVYKDFREQLYNDPDEIAYKQEFHSGRANQWKFADYNGDGMVDLLIGVSDWREYGWDDAFNSDGNWTNGPLHGYIYRVMNRGSNENPDYGKAMKIMAGGSPLDVYGKPSPNEYTKGRFLRVSGKILHLELEMPEVVVYDWDNDEDPDIVAGKEDGRVVLIENTGMDRDGMPVLVQPVYFRQKAEYVKCGALSTPCSYDWDGDGDEDIISGNTAGFIEWIENLGVHDTSNTTAPGLSESEGSISEGPASERAIPERPALEWAAPKRLLAGDKVFRIMAGSNLSIQGPAEAKWGYTVPYVADWNMDGLPDIILNSIVGKIIWPSWQIHSL